jgi:hypothetical protein
MIAQDSLLLETSCRGCGKGLPYRGYGRPAVWCDDCYPSRYPKRTPPPVRKVSRGQSGQVRATDPDTSAAAARAITGRTEALILGKFRSMGCSMTDDELCDALPNHYPPTVKSARSRLSNHRLLVDSGERRLSYRGCQQIAWKLS